MFNLQFVTRSLRLLENPEQIVSNNGQRFSSSDFQSSAHAKKLVISAVFNIFRRQKVKQKRLCESSKTQLTCKMHIILTSINVLLSFFLANTCYKMFLLILKKLYITHYSLYLEVVLHCSI